MKSELALKVDRKFVFQMILEIIWPTQLLTSNLMVESRETKKLGLRVCEEMIMSHQSDVEVKGYGETWKFEETHLSFQAGSMNQRENPMSSRNIV